MTRERRSEVKPTGFEDILVDLDLSSDWLPILQVGKVRQWLGAGGGAGGGAGVTIGDAVTRAVGPATWVVLQHCHQLSGGSRYIFECAFCCLFVSI